MFVIGGMVEIIIGETRSVVHENQFLQFYAGEAHRYTNPGGTFARVLMAIDYAL